MERTRLEFLLTLKGQFLPFEVNPMLDGRPIGSGERVALGSHHLVISHPKVIPFSTNIFIWYGEHNLGNVDLRRAHGTLVVGSTPIARIIDIRGPEFALTLTNSAGTNVIVPADEYIVEAEYLHWRERRETIVSMTAPGVWNFAPKLGTLLLTCKRAGASFQLLQTGGEFVEAGNFPSTIRDVPEGNYKFITWHNGNRQDQTLSLRSGVTNDLEVEFRYGCASLETEPPGATVTAKDGRNYGLTPCNLSELLPGSWEFNLRKEGYEPVDISLVIAADETNTCRTNLVSRDYTGAVNSARRFLEAKDYARALEAALDAIRAQPNDAMAIALKTEATGLGKLKHAETLGQQGQFDAAIAELGEVLKLLPGNAHAQAILAQFRERASEQAEKARMARLNRPHEVFSNQLALNPDSKLFESHELKSKRKAAEVFEGIAAALRDQAPTFTIGLRSNPEWGISLLVAKREAWNQARICVIVVGQITDEETQIMFEVLEYKVDVAGKILGAVLSAPLVNGQNKGSPNQPDPHVPLHPSRVGPLTEKMKTQLEEGVRIIRDKILAVSG